MAWRITRREALLARKVCFLVLDLDAFCVGIEFFQETTDSHLIMLKFVTKSVFSEDHDPPS